MASQSSEAGETEPPAASGWRVRQEFADESRALVRIAGPIILSQLGSVGLTTMDTVMVGPLGAEAIAAVGLSSTLHWALLVVTTGTLFGMGPLVSQAYGAGDRSQCRQILVQGLWIALALAVPMFAVNALGEPIALALGQDAGISSTVGGYMWALAWGVPPILLFAALRQYLEGMGHTGPAMVVTFLGLAVNLPANAVLIYGFGDLVEPMGAIGSGWATTVVRWSMLLAMVGYILWSPRLHPLRGVDGRPDSALIGRIVKIGAPTGAQIGLEVGLFSFAAIMMGWFNPTVLGAHHITLNIAATTFMVGLGFSLAGSIRVGHRLGAGDVEGVRRAVLITYALAVSSMGIFAILFLLFPEAILRLYTDDPAVLRLGASLLLMAALFQVFDGAQAAGFAVLRGAADTRIPMVIAGLAYWGIGAPAAYLLAFRSPLGPVGVWLGLVLGLVAASALLAWRVRRIHWSPVRPVGIHRT